MVFPSLASGKVSSLMPARVRRPNTKTNTNSSTPRLVVRDDRCCPLAHRRCWRCCCCCCRCRASSHCGSQILVERPQEVIYPLRVPLKRLICLPSPKRAYNVEIFACVEWLSERKSREAHGRKIEKPKRNRPALCRTHTNPYTHTHTHTYIRARRQQQTTAQPRRINARLDQSHTTFGSTPERRNGKVDTMSDTTLHDLCKGFGALLTRSKVRSMSIPVDGKID